MVLRSPYSHVWLAFTRGRKHCLTRVIETFQRIFSESSHYLFIFIFFVCRCKHSICNSLIPRAMGVLGSLNSGQVASWDMILCLQVMAGAEGGQAVKSLAHSPFLFLCASFCSSRRVYTYSSRIHYLPKLCCCTPRKRT